MSRTDSPTTSAEAPVPSPEQLWNEISHRFSRGDLQGAAAALRQLAALQPEIPDHRLNLGLLLVRLEQFPEALDTLLPLQDRYSGNANLWLGLGLSSCLVGQSQEAVRFLDCALRIDPGNISGRLYLARAHIDLGRLDDARVSLSPLAARQLASDETNLLVQVLIDLRAFQEAEARLRAAVDRDPRNNTLLTTLASLCERGNRIGEAKEILSRVDSPDEFGRYLRARLLGRSGDKAEALVALDGLRQVLDHERLPHLSAQIDFERGEVLEHLKSYGEAFVAYREGNRKDATDFARLRSAREGEKREDFLADAPETDGVVTASAESGDGQRPVFIVGFPRSGTTLLDRILGTHAEIQVIEEQPTLEPLVLALSARAGGYPRSIGQLSPKEIQSLRHRYWDEVRRYLSWAPGKLLVEKNPFNMLRAPLIAMLFPKARWIFLSRHPADVVLSCFSRRFGYTPITQGFCDLADIASLYRASNFLWNEHVHRFGLDVTTLRYEDLVRNPEEQLNRLLDILRVSRAPLASSFESQSANDWVLTPSYDQVARGVYTSSIGRWTHFREELKPVTKQLGDLIAAMGYNLGPEPEHASSRASKQDYQAQNE